MPGPPPLTVNGWLRFDVISRLLTGIDARHALEVGAGVGALGARLAERYEYVGLEPDLGSAAIAARRIERVPGARLIQGTTSSLGPEERFDLVVACEVLEHIEDDAGALRDWLSRVRDRGHLLVSVPAGAGRFASADEKAGHFRRYERSDLERLCDEVGLLDPEIVSYGFPLGNALRWVWNVIARIDAPRGSKLEQTSSSGRWLQPPEQLGWLTAAISWPFRLVQRRFATSDLGIGFVVLARVGGTDAEV
jgi:SAM-dependent methyltransferase